MTRPATEVEVLAAENDSLARQVAHFKRAWGRAVVRGEKAARQHKSAQAEVERLTGLVKTLCKSLHDTLDDVPCDDCGAQGFYFIDGEIQPCVCTDVGGDE
jgi:hypothetical protein